MSPEMGRGEGLEKQMGCMSGFFQLFDRNQGLSGKRMYSAKRLPPPAADASSESGKSSPAFSAAKRQYPYAVKSPEMMKQSPEKTPEPPPKSPLPLLFEIKEGSRSSWKFYKETPRLSLDSRAITDAKGGLHPREIRTTSILSAASAGGDGGSGNAADENQQFRSPSVIARLMGLEPLSDSEPAKVPELRRSSSESRVSRDLFRSRFIAEAAANLFSKQHPPSSAEKPPPGRRTDPRKYFAKNNNNNHSARDSEQQKQSSDGSSFSSLLPRKPPPPRKSFYDSGDFFPEPRQILSFHGGAEKNTNGVVDKPANDLETLKQILEALQLKGLLRSKKSPELSKFSHRNFVYDDSPSPNAANRSSGLRRNYKPAGEISPAVSPRSDRCNIRVPGRYSSPTPAGRRPPNTTTLSVATTTQRRTTESSTSDSSRRNSPIHSPKLNPRRSPSVSPRTKTATVHQKERRNTPPITAATEDESSSISGSSSSITTATTDTEAQRSKSDEPREGKNLLERCDKLLNSIAEITATEQQQQQQQQPSPVSVLDSTFYKDDSSTPSPVLARRNIDFKDHRNSGDSEDEGWSTPIADGDFLYVSDVVRACRCLPRDSDIFLALEKQRNCSGGEEDDGTAGRKASVLRRLLIFDAVNEILDRKRRLPPWRCEQRRASIGDVWSEFVRNRGVETGEKDLFRRIADVMRKDLRDDCGTMGWGEWTVEMGDAVLDIERLVFKDLISDTIRDFATSASPVIRRKLIF